MLFLTKKNHLYNIMYKYSSAGKAVNSPV